MPHRPQLQALLAAGVVLMVFAGWSGSRDSDGGQMSVLRMLQPFVTGGVALVALTAWLTTCQTKRAAAVVTRRYDLVIFAILLLTLATTIGIAAAGREADVAFLMVLFLALPTNAIVGAALWWGATRIRKPGWRAAWLIGTVTASALTQHLGAKDPTRGVEDRVVLANSLFIGVVLLLSLALWASRSTDPRTSP